ncbi:mRNA cap guanine-N7 methyltransferase [Hypoxylon texense]
MTKQWDTYEATIKTLYADNTLSVVRQIMIDKTRAYRGRLIRWGVRKYNCRKLSDRASSRASSVNDGAASSESEPASPVLLSRSGGNLAPPAVDQDAVHHQLQVEMGQRASDGGHLAMPGRVNRQYGTVGGGDPQTQAYSTDDNKTKAVLSPPQPGSSAQYDWNTTSSPLTADHNNNTTSHGPNGFDGHVNATMSPPYFSGYTPMAPPASVGNAYTATIETSYSGLPDHSVNNHGHSMGYYRTPPQQQGHDYDGTAGQVSGGS